MLVKQLEVEQGKCVRNELTVSKVRHHALSLVDIHRTFLAMQSKTVIGNVYPPKSEALLAVCEEFIDEEEATCCGLSHNKGKQNSFRDNQASFRIRKAIRKHRMQTKHQANTHKKSSPVGLLACLVCALPLSLPPSLPLSLSLSLSLSLLSSCLKVALQ